MRKKHLFTALFLSVFGIIATAQPFEMEHYDSLGMMEYLRHRPLSPKEKSYRRYKEVLDAKQQAQDSAYWAIIDKLPKPWAVAARSIWVEDALVEALLAKEAYEMDKYMATNHGKSFIFNGLFNGLDNLIAQQAAKEDSNAVLLPINTIYGFPKGFTINGGVHHLRIDDNKTIYSAGAEGFWLRWQMPDSLYVLFEKKNKVPPVAMAAHNLEKHYLFVKISPDNRYLARYTNRGGSVLEILERDGDTSKLVSKTAIHQGKLATAILFSPDNKGVFTVSVDGTIGFTSLDGKFENLIPKLPAETQQRVTSLTLSNDGQFLFGASDKSNKIWIWNLTDKNLFKTLSVREDSLARRNIAAVAIGGKDDRFIAAGYMNGYIRIWDLLRTPTEDSIFSKLLPYHTKRISDLVFSPDANTLLACSYDKTASLWHIKDEKWNFPYEDPGYIPFRLGDGSDGVAASVAFSPDGKTAFVGYISGAIRYWHLDLSYYANEICLRAQKNLSNNLWVQYFGTNGKPDEPPFVNIKSGKRTPLSTCINPITNKPCEQMQD